MDALTCRRAKLMRVELPELDGILSRLNTLEEVISGLRAKLELPKQWYSLKESAVYLGISSKSVRRLLKRGLLRKSLGLRHIKISREALEEYRRRTTS
jgi:excisionase family DNA binding protein